LACSALAKASLSPPAAGGASDRHGLIITTGPVPLKHLNMAAFQAQLASTGDPVPRPEGSRAPAALVAGFSRFLRHSMEPEASERPAVPRAVRSSESDKRARGAANGAGANASSHRIDLDKESLHNRVPEDLAASGGAAWQQLVVLCSVLTTPYGMSNSLWGIACRMAFRAHTAMQAQCKFILLAPAMDSNTSQLRSTHQTHSRSV
jgi:hypothetical protein